MAIQLNKFSYSLEEILSTVYGICDKFQTLISDRRCIFFFLNLLLEKYLLTGKSEEEVEDTENSHQVSYPGSCLDSFFS